MIDCEAMQERMPLVAHGGAGWNDTEAAHLSSCAECAAEWRVVQAAVRLGESAAHRIDPARVSVAVLGRLAAERRAARWKRSGWLAGLAAAAAVVLLVSRGQPGRDSGADAPTPPPGTAQALRVPLAELENLDASELEAVLDGLDAPLGSQAAPDAPHLGDLDDNQLERVLRSLEG